MSTRTAAMKNVWLRPVLMKSARMGAAVLIGWLHAAEGATLDLRTAVVVVPKNAATLEQQAVTMLIEEVERRTQIRWARMTEWPEQGAPVIAVGTMSALRTAGSKAADLIETEAVGPAEGFCLRAATVSNSPVIVVAGNDERGVMYGVGRLLRELRMNPATILLPSALRITSAPTSRLRGHQLGYRPKTNSYDAWDAATWEQSVRDLVIFGCNAIELIPPRSDDAADSPHFPLPPMQMMIQMSRLADRYGLDVWIWYPALDQDYADPKTVEFALQEWAGVFRQLPRIDAVFVPGGDPGHTPPRHLMALLERQTGNLHRFHPKAEMWVSPQGFDQTWLNEFVQIMRDQRPVWLKGIVFGPQVRVDLPVLRHLIPAQYPIRHYPDITHSRQCQYPVPDWDRAYAMTEGRECINPRPRDQAAIFRATSGDTIGFITYSEGCNDDVNKTVWSALGWDPKAEVVDILREYSRYFIGETMADGFAQALLALEQNWRGPLQANAGVMTTLQQFQTLERAATPRQLQNWRFQQALFRAYYDAYTRSRLAFETELERQAAERLRQATIVGSRTAMVEAERLLDRAVTESAAPALRERIFELGASLYQSIGMQLSVSKYRAIAVDRGACLDTLEFPLNNRLWLKEQFGRVRTLGTEPERLVALRQIADWENPGAGGFYDDLGNSVRQPHLVRDVEFDKDPGFMRSPRSGFAGELNPSGDATPQGARRVAWLDHAETLYDTPLQVQYTGLDPTSQYKVRVVYAGDSPRRQIRLVANQNTEIHPLLVKPLPFQVLEFDLPLTATSSGSLTLSWYGEPGQGGNGRGCQVSEVWLVKKATE